MTGKIETEKVLVKNKLYNIEVHYPEDIKILQKRLAEAQAKIIIDWLKKHNSYDIETINKILGELRK